MSNLPSARGWRQTQQNDSLATGASHSPKMPQKPQPPPFSMCCHILMTVEQEFQNDRQDHYGRLVVVGHIFAKFSNS